ncbi:MAG: FAD-binding oxidoreductase [Proteobacteria bacterium]|nr:MAG: FAD-binding oxidoreductase [Pseudomonadota bacterium]QKK12361.1 MAG: FAD-binding oxidoreductase [Pseudomonadota bacterium]
MSLPSQFADALASLVGVTGIITDTEALAPYVNEERGRFRGQAAALVRPADTHQVAEVVRLCAAHGIPITPQGGNTGLCGGGVPHGGIILSLARMNRVRTIDPINYTVTVEAGAILAEIQQAADREGCLFPLSLGAEGSCQIGGNLATNAGGINVLRYGNARDLVLGLEVVLPDGRIWDGLRALSKDNTGYALKHLFVGSEGTLGIITAAVLKLFPKPLDVQTALCGLDSVQAATHLLSLARARSGDAVTGFELISNFAMEITTRHVPDCVNPLAQTHPWYVLIELSSSRPDAGLRSVFEGLLEEAYAKGVIADAAVAESLEQARRFWRLREAIPEAQKREGSSIKHDVAVPVSRVAEFIERGIAAVTQTFPGVRPCPFGHLGDGNIHFNITQPVGMDKSTYLAQWEAMNRVVHDLVAEMDGSISAEHGVGLLKVDEIRRYKSPVELDLMENLKRALDPDNLMNPGKVVRLSDLRK